MLTQAEATAIISAYTHAHTTFVWHREGLYTGDTDEIEAIYCTAYSNLYTLLTGVKPTLQELAAILE